MTYIHNQYTYVIYPFSSLCLAYSIYLCLSLLPSLPPSFSLSLSFFTPVAPGPALFIMWMTLNMNQFSFFLRWKMRGPDGIKLKKRARNKKRRGKAWMSGGKELGCFFVICHYIVFCSLYFFHAFCVIVGDTWQCWIKVLDFLRHHALHQSFSHDLHCRFFILQTRKL